MKSPFILLVSGPAGAGKSTVASSWAASRPRPTMHIALDDMGRLQKSGRANPEDGWNDECQWQYDLAQEACAGLARLYLSRGFSCAIDHPVFPDWEAASYADWANALAGLPHFMVILLPSLERCLERNALRTGVSLLRRETVEMIHPMMTPWREQTEFPVIDNTDMTVDQTVAAIDRELEA